MDEGIIAIDDDGRHMMGWTVDATSGGVQNHTEDPAPWAIVGNSEEVASVYQGTELRQFYSRLFEKDCHMACNCKLMMSVEKIFYRHVAAYEGEGRFDHYPCGQFELVRLRAEPSFNAGFLLLQKFD